MKGDYANGRIYKIEPICEHDENEVYYGSTCQLLCKRMDFHRSGYKSWKAGKRGKTRSFDLLDKYGVENCKIYLVESYPCETKEELLSREGYYIKNNKCVNKKVAGRTMQRYKEENKEKIRDYKKKYQQDNKIMLSVKSKTYRDANKDSAQARGKEYRKIRYTCSCGSEVSLAHKHDHLKTKKHIEWQNEQNVEEVNDV
jgi:hypothetical protein